MSIGRAIYLLLVNVSFFAVGTTLWCILTLFRRRLEHWKSYLLAKLGMLATVGTILALVVPNPVPIPPSLEAFVYISGVLLFGIGMIGVSRDVNERAATRFVEERKEEGRFVSLEKRMVAEEVRNTGIEDFADETRKRLGSAEQHAEEHGEARPEEHEKPNR